MLAQTFLLGAAPAQSSLRERLSLNADWRFKPGDPQDAVGKLDYAQIKDWVTAVRQLNSSKIRRPPRSRGRTGIPAATLPMRKPALTTVSGAS